MVAGKVLYTLHWKLAFGPWVLSSSSDHVESVLLTIVDRGTVGLDFELSRCVRS